MESSASSYLTLNFYFWRSFPARLTGKECCFSSSHVYRLQELSTAVHRQAHLRGTAGVASDRRDVRTTAIEQLSPLAAGRKGRPSVCENTASGKQSKGSAVRHGMAALTEGRRGSCVKVNWSLRFTVRNLIPACWNSSFYFYLFICDLETA